MTDNLSAWGHGWHTYRFYYSRQCLLGNCFTKSLHVVGRNTYLQTAQMYQMSLPKFVNQWGAWGCARFPCLVLLFDHIFVNQWGLRVWQVFPPHFFFLNIFMQNEMKQNFSLTVNLNGDTTHGHIWESERQKDVAGKYLGASDSARLGKLVTPPVSPGNRVCMCAQINNNSWF